MTIQEVEKQTGLERATVRYYEKEGLISPARAKNGYRDYSDVDLELLKKIKLLRSLSIPLEEIKSLKSGDTQLLEALDKHINRLEDEDMRLKSSQRVCREMVEDSVTFETLDAGRYLKSLEQVTSPLPPKSLEPDASRPLYAPWRRFFARFLDNSLYDIIWYLLLTAVFRTPIKGSLGQELLNSIFVIFMMLTFEPLLLKLWGTTPGKWLCGLYVTDESGGRLSYFDALSRTWSVLWRGYGLFIPVYYHVRLWKCKKAQENGEELPWEEESVLELKDENEWRVFAYLGAIAACIFAVDFIIHSAVMPRHRGDITPEEFAQNFNDLANYYDYGLSYTLLSDGTWEGNYISEGGVIEGGMIKYDYKYDYGSSVHYAPIPPEYPDLHITVEDGLLTGVSMSMSGSGEYESLYNERVLMILASAAFAGAQREVRILSNDITDIMSAVSLEEFESFSFDVGALTVSCDAVQSGYFYASGMLIDSGSMNITGEYRRENAGERQYTISFSITKNPA